MSTGGTTSTQTLYIYVYTISSPCRVKSIGLRCLILIEHKLRDSKADNLKVIRAILNSQNHI